MNYISIFNTSLLLRRLSTRFSSKIFWITIFVLAVGLFIFYIFQVSSFSLVSYKLQDYQQKIAALSEQNRALEINFAKADILDNVGSKVTELGFEKIDAIHYIQILDPSLVVK